MSVVKNMFGKRGLFIYIFTIAILSIIFALVLDTLFSDIKVQNFINHNEHFTIFNYIATAIMLILMIYFWRKK